MNHDHIATATALAIEQGELAWGAVSPNPPVGCAIIDPTGRVVGVGHTQSPHGSGEHAEVMALRRAGDKARGATAVVTLEPCNHTGRTGPCSHALVDAGISTVVYLTADPNPLAAGGAAYLREHGVSVLFQPTAVAALEPWLTSVAQGRPAITVKMAHTLDGFSAARDGTSQWISGEDTREYSVAARARFDAIVVGTGTALADNPTLSARRADGSLCRTQPLPVIVGSRELPRDLTLIQKGALRYGDPREAVAALQERGVCSILVEGGPILVGSFLAAGLVDFVHSYVSTSVLGAGRTAVDLGALTPNTLSQMHRFDIMRVRQFKSDILIESRPIN